MMVNSLIPKPKLLDFLELVTVPSNGETSMANQLDDLSKENSMLRKVLAEKSVPTPSPRGAWKDKVRESSVGRVNLEFIPPHVINDRIVVSPPAEVEEQGLGRWKNCLVGHFLDKKVPFQMVRAITMKIWEKFGISDVLANDSGFFFFVFAHDGDLFKVLEAGPWLIGVCVEVNLDSSFPESFDLLCPNGDSMTVNIKYPWLPLKCLRCKVFGHSDAHCPTKPKPIPGAVLVETVGTPAQAGSDSLGGTKPDVAVSPPREGGPKDFGHSQVPSMPTCAKVVVQSPSRIRICDDAAIEMVVVMMLLLRSHGAALTSNRFSPLSAKEADMAGGGSDIIASSSTEVIEVVGQPVEPVLSVSQEVVVLPMPQEGKAKIRPENMVCTTARCFPVGWQFAHN
ncbi:hypothetical protein RHGRI_010824 [Rhododendron griersonianum]|uniref:DUF4283 domain-containing protein n=1 Tax=Rhododendron griersonianum TaxID=479676 RepID=A0AAV6KKK6_9ERIC|nr:hypothetical protein RHGRI_010824 [Rhododendron griersonianum]